MVKDFLVGMHPEPTLKSEIAMTGLRVFTGLTMAFAHGIGKIPPSAEFVAGVSGLGFPMPEIAAWLASFAEFGGGIALALGLLTRPAAAMIAVTMTVAAFGVHAMDPFQKKEMALIYLALSLFFALRGSGRLSVDRYLK